MIVVASAVKVCRWISFLQDRSQEFRLEEQAWFHGHEENAKLEEQLERRKLKMRTPETLLRRTDEYQSEDSQVRHARRRDPRYVCYYNTIKYNYQGFVDPPGSVAPRNAFLCFV